MTTKERLHKLVEELPDSEWPTAERILKALRDTAGDPVLRALEEAPEEEPAPEELAAILDAKARMAAGERGVSHEEARRLLLEEP